MRARNVIRWITPLIAGALLALLAGCAEEARPSAEPPPAPSAQADATPAPPSSPVPSTRPDERTSSAAPVGRSRATPPAPRQVDAPVSVEVPAVDIDADVVAVGAAEDGQMELPEDPNVVGWYRFGPAAGAGAGSVVIGGHVDSRRYGLGQLARLADAEVGDEVVVRTNAGAVHQYTIVDVQRIPKTELPVADVFSRDGAERLLLITCAGDFDGSHYSDNAIVTAEPK